MFNKLLADTYSKVISKADEFRSSVAAQAARAREVIGLPLSNRLDDAVQLEKHLEAQSSQAVTLSQLHNLYVRWIAELITSSGSTLFYFDHHTGSGSKQLNAASAIEAAFGLTSTDCKSPDISPGDITCPATWISSCKVSEPTELAVAPPSSSDISHPPPVPSSVPLLTEMMAADPTFVPPQAVATAAATEWLQPLEGIRFREVFLRSQALELALLSLARLQDIRGKLVGPTDPQLSLVENEEASTRGALYRLLALTMRGDAKLHQELLFLLCSVDLSSEPWEVHLRHLAELTSICKNDWLVEHFTVECRRRLDEIEVLKYSLSLPDNELIRSSTSSATPLKRLSSSSEPVQFTSMSSGDHHDMPCAEVDLHNRCRQSRKVAQLYHELEQINQRAEKRRELVERASKHRLERLLSSVDALYVKFSNIESRAIDRGAIFAAEMTGAATEIEVKLKKAVDEKEKIDAIVNKLELEVKELLARLDAVSQELVEWTRKQTDIIRNVENAQHNKLMLTRRYDHKVAVATELQHQSDLHKLDMENMKLLVQKTQHLLVPSSSPLSSDKKTNNDDIIIQQPCLKKQLQAAIVSHLELQVKWMESQSASIEEAVSRLQHVWTVREQKVNLKTKIVGEIMNYNKQISSTSLSDAESLEHSLKLEQVDAKLVEVSDAVAAACELVEKAQRTLLHHVKELELAWKEIVEFLDQLSGEVDANAMLSTPLTPEDNLTSQAPSTTLQLVSLAKTLHDNAKNTLAIKTKLLEMPV